MRPEQSHHRTRRKGDEADEQTQVVPRSQEVTLQEPAILTSAHQGIQVRYDRTTVSGNGVGYFGNVYGNVSHGHHTHIHNHHYYHGVPQSLSLEAWVAEIAERTMASIQTGKPNFPEMFDSNSSALHAPWTSSASSPSSNFEPPPLNDAAASYDTIQNVLPPVESDSSGETVSIINSTMSMLEASLLSSPSTRSIFDDNSSEHTYATCIEEGSQPSPNVHATSFTPSNRDAARTIIVIGGITIDEVTFSHPSHNPANIGIGAIYSRQTWVEVIGVAGCGKSQLAVSAARLSMLERQYWTIVSPHQHSDLLRDTVAKNEDYLLEASTLNKRIEVSDSEPLLNLAPGQSQRAVCRLDLARACSVDASVRFRHLYPSMFCILWAFCCCILVGSEFGGSASIMFVEAGPPVASTCIHTVRL